MIKNPYLSIITHTRNDNYAGGSEALFNSLRHTIKNLEDVQIFSEIVLVDWNSPPENGTLQTKLKHFLDSLKLIRKFVSIKLIVVPPRIHKTYRGWRERNINAVAAVNVGIRRCNGRFIVIKSMDTFWSKGIYGIISKKKLKKEKIYRCVRKDYTLPSGFSLVSLKVEQYEDFLKEHIVHSHDRNLQTYRVKRKKLAFLSKRDEISRERESDFPMPNLFTNASGDFQLCAREVFFDLESFEELNNVYSYHTDSTFSYCAYASGVMEEILSDDCVVYKPFHGQMFSETVRVKRNFLENWARDGNLSQFILKRFHSDDIVDFSRIIFGRPKTYVKGQRVPDYDSYMERMSHIVRETKTYKLNKSGSWGNKIENFIEIVF